MDYSLTTMSVWQDLQIIKRKKVPTKQTHTKRKSPNYYKTDKID